MALKKVRYEDLSQLLARLGTQQSAGNLRNKINRGILGADLLLQILISLEVKRLDRETILDILSDVSYSE